MTDPDQEDMSRARQVMKYLMEHPELKIIFEWQETDGIIDVYTDSDWATCPVTRKSVSGGTILNGKHLIAHWTRLQPVVSTSSGEAELVAACTAMSELILVENLSEDMNHKWKGRMNVDARACKGIVLRKGVGKLKHLTIKFLWIQAAVAARKTEVRHIPRHLNVADMFTHGISSGELARHMSTLSCRFTRLCSCRYPPCKTLNHDG